MKKTKENRINVTDPQVPALENTVKEPFLKGRISRREFILSYAIFIFLGILAGVLSPEDDWGLTFLTSLITAIVTAGLIVQRLHDLGRPGYHYWLSWVPVYNIIFILFDLCGQKGQKGENRYGVEPLQ